jgi:hypothetical protein
MCRRQCNNKFQSHSEKPFLRGHLVALKRLLRRCLPVNLSVGVKHRGRGELLAAVRARVRRLRRSVDPEVSFQGCKINPEGRA